VTAQRLISRGAEVDVLTTAWIAAGRPAMQGTLTGTCARCGRVNVALTATRAVVSKTFTAYDSWHHPSGPGLCSSCTWGFRTAALRLKAHLVTVEPLELRQMQPADVGQYLDRALPADVALVVPLRPGRKHLLPGAVWGRVTLDDAHLPWSAEDACRLAAARRLRCYGFGSRMLAAAVPPWSVLRRLPRNYWTGVMTNWEALAPWRARRPWLELAVYATMREQGEVAA
jgi:hypothetical protein